MPPSHIATGLLTALVGATLLGCGGTSAPMKSLSRAIERGDTATALAILDAEKSLDLNAQDWGGRTVLHQALEHKNEKVYAKLLALGADPNLCDSNGACIMNQAAKEPDSYWLREALAHGGQPNALNVGNRHTPNSTPMH